MKTVVDTNVLVSGIFWGGKPGKVLEHWRSGKLDILATSNTEGYCISEQDGYPVFRKDCHGVQQVNN